MAAFCGGDRGRVRHSVSWLGPPRWPWYGNAALVRLRTPAAGHQPLCLTPVSSTSRGDTSRLHTRSLLRKTPGGFPPRAIC
jgi:hypothetical protein